MQTSHTNAELVRREFHEGDAVVLSEGTYQGTRGEFLHMTDDATWAEIREHSGRVRSHPLAWLAAEAK